MDPTQPRVVMQPATGTVHTTGGTTGRGTPLAAGEPVLVGQEAQHHHHPHHLHSMRSHATHVGVDAPTHHLPGEVHHTPNSEAASDPERQYLHDGTTYATGASRDPYDAATPAAAKPSLGQRIKEAVPGTKEHKAKAEAEGNLAVYT